MGWQVAPVGQSPVAIPLHTSTQYFVPVDESLMTHSPGAVSPSGVSVGHLSLITTPVHLGKQAVPFTPWIYPAISSSMQPPEGFP